VRQRAPRGVSHVQLFSGLHRAVANDGTVEMSESDAAPLLNAGWVRAGAGVPPVSSPPRDDPGAQLRQPGECPYPETG